MLTPGKEYPGGSVVMGAPARVVRAVAERELALIKRAARSYQQRIERYLAEPGLRGAEPGVRGEALTIAQCRRHRQGAARRAG